MKKILLGLVVIVLIGAVGVFLFLGSILDSAVKTGVEQVGPKLTQTRVTLDNAAISPFSGAGSLNGLVVANPEGYEMPNAFALEQVDMDVDIASVFSGGPIVIERIYIKAPVITFEQKGPGSNLQDILDNVREATASDTVTKEEKKEPDAAEPVRMRIHSFVLEDAAVEAHVLGRSGTVNVPRIELSDLGKKEGGATADELTQEVIAQIVQQVSRTVAANAGEITKGAIEEGKKALDEGKKRVEEAKQSLEDAAKDTKETADKVRSLFD